MSKIAIFGVLASPSMSMSSHNHGHVLYLMSQLKSIYPGKKIEVIKYDQSLDQYDEIVITEGVNFREGTYNVFGGITGKIISSLQALSEFKGDIVCYDNNCPDYNEFIVKRKIPLKVNISIAKKRFSNFQKMIIGDSHSLSVYKPGYYLDRNDGKTLYGAINNIGLRKYVVEETQEAIFYFGNIDLRFHLERQGSPAQSAIRLARQYVEAVKELGLKKASIVELLPAEHESRKIPGTGLYKGRSYFGTKDGRKVLKSIFNDVLYGSGIEILKWDHLPLTSEGDLSFDAMESRQSVHLRPSSYMFINEILNEII